MRKETVVKYFADDGTPFEGNDLACKNYEALCDKYKTYLRKGRVLFWSHAKQCLNLELCDFAFDVNTNTSYLDWLFDRLRGDCCYIMVNASLDTSDYNELWEFATLYGNVGVEADRLKKDYIAGDLLALDFPICKWRNMSLAKRNIEDLNKCLAESVTFLSYEIGA
jgi:hypothetical protein